MKPIRWLAIPIICGALLAGCGTPPAGVAPAPPPPSTSAAEKAERDGEYLVAANEYMRLAQAAQAPEQQDYQLRAVAAYLKAGQLREAHQQIYLVDVSRLDSSFQARKLVLQARILS